MAQKKNHALQKLFDILIIWLTVVAVLFISVYVYYAITDKDLFTNSTSTYVASYKDPHTGEDVNAFSIQYFENYNNTGKEVVEARINGYSDQTMQAIYGRGYQLVIDGNKSELYYCDTYDGVSWSSMHKYDDTNDEGQSRNFYYVSINNELYAIRLDGSYEQTSVDGGKIVGAIFGVPYIIQSIKDNNWGFSKTETIYYTMEDLLLHFKDMIKSLSYGTGDFELPVVDLGDFIHVYSVDEDGTVSDTPIGEGGQINSYFSIDVHYDRRGITYADQSMFDSVAGDSNYNVTGINFDVNYWQAKVVYDLDESDFEYRYSSLDGGNYYFLSSATINELKGYKNLEFNITFDISNLDDENILGFDYYALNGIEVSNLTITSDTEVDFTILNGALEGTGITEINTNNVNIIDLSDLEVAVWNGGVI